LFASVGAFSAAPLPDMDPDIIRDGFDGKKAAFKLFWMACGTEDSLINAQRSFSKWSEKNAIKLTAKETPGGHVWMLWRRYLAEFAPMLFR
jgi:S-formylglutathione hydrolase FrmB